MNYLNADEQIAASVVAGLSGKREREDSADAAGGVKKVRDDAETIIPAAPQADEEVVLAHPAPPPNLPPAPEDDLEGELMPAPFYYYKDFSNVPDSDSLTPLVPPGRVPSFPAKLHAILSRSDFTEIVCWLPHGRAWKVLKPREFEVRVIPTYFEHAKFSSFIRQANGWGFRRITHGKDRNSYYHPLFLRALPHLCKEMKRPGVAKKLAADPEHEPDLYAISELHPVPTHFDDESILLHCTIQGGPKARMPIYSGSLTYSSTASSLKDILIRPDDSNKSNVASLPNSLPSTLTPRDREALSSFSTSLGASEMLIKPASTSTNLPSIPVASKAAQSLPSGDQAAAPNGPLTSAFIPPAIAVAPNLQQDAAHRISTLAAANELAFGTPHSFAAAYQASSAASQFAAGFAAAAALSHQQFQNMIQTLQQQQQQQQAVAASQQQQQHALEALQNLLASRQQGDL
jgi:HSF-type DNA-binding